jgi:hypothetical protein
MCRREVGWGDISRNHLIRTPYSRFQTFAVFWILYHLFWGDPSASEFYVTMFRNTLFHFDRWTGSVPKRRHITFRRRGITQKKGYNILIIIIIIIGIQPLGLFGLRPALSQATGITLVRCILAKFLGVGCHYFPPLFRRSHFRHQVPPRPSWRARS